MAEYRFKEGRTYILSCNGEPMREATRIELARLALDAAWFSVTRWWRPRTIVSAIDRNAGRITLTQQRWSWRRWRWESTE